MIEAIFQPIAKWTGPKTAPAARRTSPFSASYNSTLDLLEFELNHLSAKDIVIQAEVERSQIRNDGWMKSGARVNGPAVILTFESRGAIYSYPCDSYNDWQANIRAIALSLEALRKVDRYGVTRNSEQYQGFKRLAPASPKSERAAAIDRLMQLSGAPLCHDSAEPEIEAAYRAAVRKWHPDSGSYTPEQWEKLQAAIALLRRNAC